MQVDETLIRNVVEQVLAKVGNNGAARSNAAQSNIAPASAPAPVGGGNYAGRFGLFTCANEAVAASRQAFEELSGITMEGRTRIIDHIRRISTENAEEFGRMEMEETKIGRLDHKIAKQEGVGQTTPGTEFMRSEVFSGDYGLAIIEHAPFGVIAAITPVTHSLPTITCKAIIMLASGNTVVVNPHPGGKRIAAEGVRRYNEAIYRDMGIDNLICLITEPTMETADILFKHKDVNLLSVTGGPGVARAAMQQTKRAIVAGPGNPPVVVDETADFDRAARSIIIGAAFDNNLLCISEKEVFVVQSVFEEMMAAMERAGAVRLSKDEMNRMAETVLTTVGEGDQKHFAAKKEYVGRDPAELAQAIGKSIPPHVEMLFGETDESNPLVPAEQMMPCLPFVRARNVDHAIEMAKRAEHGFNHTSIIHSNDVRNMTKMGRVMNTTLFVKNGSSLAGVGNGGEGYGSYSIAGATGEGITTPMTFTRERRCTMVESLRILGK